MAAVSYLAQQAAKDLDVDLLSPDQGFHLPQLLELAGLACASALIKLYPPTTHQKVVVLCGPGNQGGDGLVAARHLWQFGYQVQVWYPKDAKAAYAPFKLQVENLGVPFLPFNDSDEAVFKALTDAHVILDAIFGFSFHHPPNPPYATIIAYIAAMEKRPAVLSVDLPSGWSVNEGRVWKDNTFVPEAIISLTVPKWGVEKFEGRHLVGGRFVPPSIAQKYKVSLPPFPGSEQVVEITGCGINKVGA